MGGGAVIRATVPYIKAPVPILILFRALGFVVCCRNLKLNE